MLWSLAPRWSLLLLLALGAVLLRGEDSASARGIKYANRLRLRFESRFNKSCLKYPFVERYLHQLENTGDRYVVFVYHEAGLRNGGLGDRIGGLITATTIALRLNRTILIESANDFGSLFRPYHPVDITRPPAEQLYSWSNWTRWSRYNASLSNNDATELDLWDCINCVTWKNRKCGMDDGDVALPIIKLRANRAFMCKWMKHPELRAHTELLPLGLDERSNLLEAAGCMMRLVMWPTERLWDFVKKDLGSLDIFKSPPPGPAAAAVADAEYGIQIGMHFRCGDWSYKRPGSYDRACEHDETGRDPHAESDYMNYATPDQLGRCAREVVFNYTEGLHGSGWELGRESIYARNGTIPFDFPKEDVTPPAPKANRALVRSQGGEGGEKTEREGEGEGEGEGRRTMMGVGRRRRRGLLWTPHHAIAENETFDMSDDWASAALGEGKAVVRVNKTLELATAAGKDATRRRRAPVVYIASDNPASANQMNRTCGWPLTYISPKGCHVEMDKSADCNLMTTAYWLLLATSDIIVHQSDQVGSPISAFSRFAAVYGLKGDSLRDAKNCSRVVPFSEMSHKWMGNWFCD